MLLTYPFPIPYLSCATSPDPEGTGVPSGSAAAAGAEKGNEKQGETKKKKPVVCIVMGMAGSGKTTLLQRLNLYTSEMGIKSYFINLDPAVKQVPFGASIDIRDTVNYKEVNDIDEDGGVL